MTSTQRHLYDVRGLEDPVKYDRLTELEPDMWWDRNGPHGGLHLVNELRVPYFERTIDGYAGKRILDIGCGGGIFAEALASGGAHVTGIDASPRSIQSARRHAAAQGLEIEYEVAEAESFEAPERFDAVLAVDVLEHVADIDLTLDTCARLLKAEGIFGFLTHNQTREAFDALVWEGEYQKYVIPKGTHDFHKFITPDDLDERLRARNLGIVDLQGVRFDMDSGVFEFVSDTAVTYMGYAEADTDVDADTRPSAGVTR